MFRYASVEHVDAMHLTFEKESEGRAKEPDSNQRRQDTGFHRIRAAGSKTRRAPQCDQFSFQHAQRLKDVRSISSMKERTSAAWCQRRKCRLTRQSSMIFSSSDFQSDREKNRATWSRLSTRVLERRSSTSQTHRCEMVGEVV